jgi:hypothetical protein
MKEFIDKLIERLEEKERNCLHNQIVFEKKHSLRLATICEIKAGVYNDAIKISNKLAEEYKLFGKTEQVKGGWIPVSERLPKEDERILCLHSDGFIDCGVLIGETWCCDMDEYAVIRDDIYAWMPLPAPYTEGE